MIYRKFQDIELSGLGLGMMRLPVIDGNDGVVDENAAVPHQAAPLPALLSLLHCSQLSDGMYPSH